MGLWRPVNSLWCRENRHQNPEPQDSTIRSRARLALLVPLSGKRDYEGSETRNRWRSILQRRKLAALSSGAQHPGHEPGAWPIVSRVGSGFILAGRSGPARVPIRTVSCRRHAASRSPADCLVNPAGHTPAWRRETRTASPILFRHWDTSARGHGADTPGQAPRPDPARAWLSPRPNASKVDSG